MEKKDKTEQEKRKDEILLSRRDGHDVVSDEELEACRIFNEEYKSFLDQCKTERESVSYMVSRAKENGFRQFSRGMKLVPGDRVFRVNRAKAVVFAVIGDRPLSSGSNIAAAHIDTPRIDLKTNPLYEDSGMAYFKTHYYGGIKKYQWLALPLELRGVVALRDGRVVEISVGADRDDPVFCITDLLPHLAGDQMKKNLSEAVSAEAMNLLIGTRPFKGSDGADRIKLNVMDILNSKYGIVEEDLASAELSLVPAHCARDVGFDRSLVGAYGHDDRACAFGAFRAALDAGNPGITAVSMLADKEETGSEGVTGMQSAFFDTFMEDLCESQGESLRECYEGSFCISADVAAAFDPNYPEPYDRRNSPKINYGVGVCKYTGSRGKSGASDASAELVARLRRVFDGAGVLWQMAPLGKVDGGGGGTVAMFMAKRNIDTIDAGVPVLSMHSPFEIISKLDNYMSYKGILAVFRDGGVKG